MVLKAPTGTTDPLSDLSSVFPCSPFPQLTMSANFEAFFAYLIEATDIDQETQGLVRPILEISLVEGGYQSGKPNFEAFWASMKEGANMADEVMEIMRAALKVGNYDKPAVLASKPAISLKPKVQTE